MLSIGIIVIALGFGPVNGSEKPANPVKVEAHIAADGSMVMHYGAPQSVKARNKWDTLNLSPNGVQPLSTPKGHL